MSIPFGTLIQRENLLDIITEENQLTIGSIFFIPKNTILELKKTGKPYICKERNKNTISRTTRKIQKCCLWRCD